MRSKYIYWKMRNFVKEVKLVSYERGYLVFEVNGEQVYRNSRREWSCLRKDCTWFHLDKECSHIYACKEWLKGRDLDED